jgi:hypothetical protein
MRKKLFGALSRYELDVRWGCRGEGDSEGDERRQRYLKDDGDIEINNAPCVIRRHGPNSMHF